MTDEPVREPLVRIAELVAESYARLNLVEIWGIFESLADPAYVDGVRAGQRSVDDGENEDVESSITLDEKPER